MEIKIGFVASPRDIVITTAEGSEDREGLLSRIEGFLAEASGTLKLEDNKGSVMILVREQVAYIEVGAATARAVGFI